MSIRQDSGYSSDYSSEPSESGELKATAPEWLPFTGNIRTDRPQGDKPEFFSLTRGPGQGSDSVEYPYPIPVVMNNSIRINIVRFHN
jgi:hypothetical protein